MSLKENIGKLARMDYYKWDVRRNRWLNAIGVIQKVARVTGENRCAYLVRYRHKPKGKVVESWFYVSDCEIVEPDYMQYDKFTWHQEIRSDLMHRPANT